jgi:tRNA (mo5U34)-methyltransferase
MLNERNAMAKLTQKDIEEMNSIEWFHRIKLSEEVTTPSAKRNDLILGELNLPEDLTGKTVLDIGAWDGYFSFECERRGAKEVLATDEYVWSTWKDGTFDKGFDFAHRILESNVKKLQVSVESLRDKPIGKFDIVLMLGVLYHAIDPLGYLRAAFEHTKEMLILETHVNLNDLPYPAIAYYPGGALADDPTNYWGPNHLAVVGMLKDVGFTQVKTFPQSNDRQVFHAFR